jgi:hypothetical protein
MAHRMLKSDLIKNTQGTMLIMTKYGKHPSGPPPPLQTFPQIWESWLKSEIIGDSSVQTMPLQTGWLRL